MKGKAAFLRHETTEEIIRIARYLHIIILLRNTRLLLTMMLFYFIIILPVLEDLPENKIFSRKVYNMKNTANTKNTENKVMTAWELYNEVDIRATSIDHVIGLLNLLIDNYHLDARELTEEQKYDLVAGAGALGEMLNFAADTLSRVTDDIKNLASDVKKAHAQESAASAN